MCINGKEGTERMFVEDEGIMCDKNDNFIWSIFVCDTHKNSRGKEQQCQIKLDWSHFMP